MDGEFKVPEGQAVPREILRGALVSPTDERHPFHGLIGVVSGLGGTESLVVFLVRDVVKDIWMPNLHLTVIEPGVESSMSKMVSAMFSPAD